MYNRYKQTGFLLAKLRNDRMKRKNADNVPVAEDLERQPETLTVEQEQHYLTLFKTCVLPEEKDKLLVALAATVSYREELLKKKEFQPTFPFYFVWPQSVSFAFSLQLILFYVRISINRFFVFRSIMIFLYDLLISMPGRCCLHGRTSKVACWKISEKISMATILTQMTRWIRFWYYSKCSSPLVLN